MKPWIFIYFLSIWSTLAVGQSITERNYVSIGGFSSLNGIFTNPDQFILVSCYEYRLPILKNHFGVGASIDFVKSPIINKKDISAVPRLYGHLVNNSKGDVYGGIGLGYAQQTQLDVNVIQKQGISLKYFFGLRYIIAKHTFCAFELSNYRFTMGVYPTLNVGIRF